MNKPFFRTAICVVLAFVCLVSVSQSGISGTPALLSIGASGITDTFQGSEVYPHNKIRNTIAKYKAENDDVTGWLIVPGTGISEPVCFNPKTNASYIKRDWKGNTYPIDYSNWNKYPATATYLEYRTKIGKSWTSGTSRNIVLYGHNWNNLREPFAIGNKAGYTMFAQLPSYTNMDFATKHPYIYFSTSDLEGIWKVFSVAYSEVSANFPYNSPNQSKEDLGKLVTEWKNRSIFNFSTEVDETDRILTLSTCTRQYPNVGAEQRYVVVARLLREGESENDKVKVAVNPNIKQPRFSSSAK